MATSLSTVPSRDKNPDIPARGSDRCSKEDHGDSDIMDYVYGSSHNFTPSGEKHSLA